MKIRGIRLLRSGPMLLALSCAALPFSALAQSRAPALPTETIIQKHIAARGGLAAIKAIHTLRMTGTMRPVGFDVRLDYDETIARPGKVRIDATIQGLTIVQSWDGSGGWQIQPFQGRKDPEALSEDDTKSLVEEADFEGPLIDAAAKGARIENLGVIDVDGAPAYALRATLKNGDQQTYYIDPDQFLTVRITTRQVLRGSETFTRNDFGDYEKIDGVYFPMEISQADGAGQVQQRITYDKIVANAPVDDATFARPHIPNTGVTGPAAEDKPAPGEKPKIPRTAPASPPMGE